jgi:hypothetical protein
VAAPRVDGWRRRIALLGVGLVALAPLAYLLGNLGRLDLVTPDLVSANLLPQVLVAAGLALVTVAVTAEVLGSGPGDGRRPPRATASDVGSGT